MSYEYARYRTTIFFWLGPSGTRMQYGATPDCENPIGILFCGLRWQQHLKQLLDSPEHRFGCGHNSVIACSVRRDVVAWRPIPAWLERTLKLLATRSMLGLVVTRDITRDRTSDHAFECYCQPKLRKIMENSPLFDIAEPFLHMCVLCLLYVPSVPTYLPVLQKYFTFTIYSDKLTIDRTVGRSERTEQTEHRYVERDLLIVDCSWPGPHKRIRSRSIAFDCGQAHALASLIGWKHEAAAT